MRRGPERGVPHTGTETRPRLLREAAVRNIGQWVRVKALRVYNLFDTGAIRSASRTDESTVRTSVG